jgi:VanZ family protein
VSFVARYSGGALAKAAFWAAALFALVMALLPHPPAIPGNPSDKVQHIAAFAVLGLLGSWAYPRLSRVRLIVLLSLFGAMIEILQAMPALHRDSDPLDWLADTIACALVITIMQRARRRR